MGMPDPWNDGSDVPTHDSCVDVSPARNFSFENDFAEKDFQRLPDSSEYVSVLGMLGSGSTRQFRGFVSCYRGGGEGGLAMV